MTTQMLIPTTDLLGTHNARQAADDLLAALDAAELIPLTGGDVKTIAGQWSAVYGPLIRIESDRLTTDGRGASWAKRLTTYAEPVDAGVVLIRLLEEGREVFTVEAVRGALGGTTTR